jgi:glycosyltransferase involved in cell wall biosynthesis
MIDEPANWAIIITHNRPELLKECIQRVEPQVDYILVLDNASDPPVKDDLGRKVIVQHDPRQPPNIARAWNEGWDYIAEVMRRCVVKTWNVAMLCDDVMVPGDWYARVAGYMRDTGAVAASAHNHTAVNQGYVKHEPDGDIYNRMHGAAYIVAGEHGLRADESMHWWWCDTDMDWQARLAGGMAIAPGPVASNVQPNFYTNTKPELGARTGEDGAAFTRKWGWKPW